MLADITVDKKAVRNKSFTYLIPQNIKPRVGSLVLVPFRNQRVVGIINSIKKEESKRFSLKKIESIIFPQTLFSQNQLKLASFISIKYFAPISSVIFTMMPHYLRHIKRSETINKILSKQSTVNSKQNNPLEAPNYKLQPKHYLLFDPQNKYSLSIYQKAIEKTLNRKQNVILLVPDLSMDIVKYAKKISSRSLIINKDNNTDKQIFLKWQAIRDGKYNLIIGSHLALFAPLENIGLIIVHHENDQYYKNDQSPKYNLREVATELARLYNSSLILQSEIPSLESYLKAKRKEFKIIPYKNFNAKLGTQTKQKIKIIDLKEERGLFSLKTIKTINQNLKNRKKTLLFLNRKGFSRFFICQDCGYSKHIESNQSTPAVCPECKSTTGREHSFGTRRLEFEMKKMFPKARILRLDNESKKNLGLKFRISDFDIIIATSYIFKFDYLFDSVIIILAEIGLSFPDYKSEEELFYTLFRALKLGKNKILQTFYPQNRVIEHLLKDNFDDFAKDQLISRKNNDYPPYSTIIRLTYEEKGNKKINLEAKKLKKMLNKLNNSYNSPNEILGPAPVFIQPKTRYKVEILLKGKNPYPLLSLVPGNWKVDVDPFELLK